MVVIVNEAEAERQGRSLSNLVQRILSEWVADILVAEAEEDGEERL